MPSLRSKEDWKALIEPHLSVSLRDASDAITRTDTVQEWLHTASMDAATGLADVSGLQGQMQGYMQMMNALEDRLPELLDAVAELTAGYGTIDLHWRPTNPNFSRLYIDFDRDFSVKVFARLHEPTTKTAGEVISTIAEALPAGTPFPKRPNSVTGLVARDGQCIGVRVSDRLADDGETIYRSVSLLPANRDDRENLSVETAAEQLAQLLAPTDSSSAPS